VTKDREKNFVTAIVYVHNAENRIEYFLEQLISVLEDHFENSEIICVNDASNDRSTDIIRECCRFVDNTSLSVINMSYFHGCELAMTAGMDLAIGDYVFEFDNTELDYDTSIIMDVYERCISGYDIVSASPDKKEKFTSRMFYKLFDRFTHLSYKMSTESFRILSRRVINRINSMNRTILYRKAMYANCGLRTDNIRYKESGLSSKLHTDRKERKYRHRLAADSMILATEIGYRFSMIMTMIMIIIAIIMIVFTVITYFTSNPVEGWTTTILFLSISFFGLFGILTIIVKYLQLLVDRAFKRKQYSFESVEKLK